MMILPLICIFLPSILTLSLFDRVLNRNKVLINNFGDYIKFAFLVNLFNFLFYYSVLKAANQLLSISNYNYSFSIKYILLSIIVSISLYLIMFIFQKLVIIRPMNQFSITDRTIGPSFFFIFLLNFTSILIFFTTFWIKDHSTFYNFEQILFHLKVQIIGSDNNIVTKFILYVLLASGIISFFSTMLIYYAYGIKLSYEVLLSNRTKFIKFEPFRFLASNKTKIALSILMLFMSATFSSKTLQIDAYIKDNLDESQFIEVNYVNPNQTKLEFPKIKKNLIYLYLESMENTYASNESGGAFGEINLIPNLTNLAETNQSFSNASQLGGPLTLTGTTWTTGGMVGQTSGLPLKIPIKGNLYSDFGDFLPGLTMLGEILEKEGYNQYLMIGSDGNFGGRTSYYASHGSYKIWDYYSAIDEGKIGKDYKVWWGVEDSKLFSYAKEKILEISQKDYPFNISLLTANTHHIGGYLESDCGKNSADQFSNVISCSDKQVLAFINWIKAQSFYENTTIIITGDHLSMDPEYFKGIDPTYVRSTYNAFINSSVTTKNLKGRVFTSLDFFPTTLASIGVTIEGNRLGLGTNLFSNEKTLAEVHGIDYLNNELSKKSVFYDETFLYSRKK